MARYDRGFAAIAAVSAPAPTDRDQAAIGVSTGARSNSGASNIAFTKGLGQSEPGKSVGRQLGSDADRQEAERLRCMDGLSFGKSLAASVARGRPSATGSRGLAPGAGHRTYRLADRPIGRSAQRVRCVSGSRVGRPTPDRPDMIRRICGLSRRRPAARSAREPAPRTRNSPERPTAWGLRTGRVCQHRPHIHRTV